ncbi:Cas9 inhibitor AcrIIA9 family protein [uncultured Oscillibacter sp.]|uniref:Cas9 inhibitor AcrIIA9 family protein n=1 Tax=uncultured Oscillibacter sp. TaxID=876091 RepID=UPI0025F766D1|nr:Cas9 inhibitor AcrIIA9 family protein [uncultured Oscillibacter sp.]
MGFFSEIVSEARKSSVPSQSAAPEPPQEAPPAPDQTASMPAPTLAKPEPVPEQETAPAASMPPPELKLDTKQDAVPAPDDTAARQTHEAAEAKRKAEWDAKQAEKKAARQAALDRIGKMNRNELLKASVERVAADTERLTRRNMKEAVAEHVQAKCREDASFAMLVMAPEKSMIRCFRYISRQAQKYAEQEMKDNGIERTGVYGLDVPDGLCFQWAEDYFRDENAEEDHKDDEKFVPKPYVSTNRKAAKSKTDKKPSPAAKPKAEKPKAPGMEQLTLGVM